MPTADLIRLILFYFCMVAMLCFGLFFAAFVCPFLCMLGVAL